MSKHIFAFLLWGILPLSAQSYSRNAATCDQCHSVPTKFGSSRLTVQRIGSPVNGKFVPGGEGGILHRTRTSSTGSALPNQMLGDRVTINLLGDGYIEALDGNDIRRNAEKQREEATGISGVVVTAPALESKSRVGREVGRFGWKAQHSSLLSASADSMRNELGIRNQLYRNEYPGRDAQVSQAPFDKADGRTGRTELAKLVEEIRRTAPPERDEEVMASPEVQEGENLFTKVGCSICHIPTYRTLPPRTFVNGGTYRIPSSLGNKVIHPYSDFLLHNVGSGDGIPQAAKPEYLDQSTADKFRTAPLWGLRFRSWMMHDGRSVTYHQAIMRHGGEATKVRERYEALPPVQKQQLRAFLNSL